MKAAASSAMVVTAPVAIADGKLRFMSFSSSRMEIQDKKEDRSSSPSPASAPRDAASQR